MSLREVQGIWRRSTPGASCVLPADDRRADPLDKDESVLPFTARNIECSVAKKLFEVLRSSTADTKIEIPGEKSNV